MDVVSLCPFVASKVVWQAHSGTFALTVIVKATFILRPGVAQLAPEQDPIIEHDRFYDEDPRRSVRVPNDVVPYKPRADVLLVGHAYAPGKQPVRSLVTRFVVGEMDKSIEVFCDRSFRVLDGQLVDGKRFTQMPLVWERASGGPESANPVGKRFDGPTDAYGMITIGNLQPLGHFVSKRSDTFVPICYAPVAPTWPGRTQRLGRLSRAILDGAWNAQPLPPDLDPTFFMAAPPDQNVPEIRANERIVMENLHTEHARLVTSLPGLRPRAIADRATGEREEIALVGDTFWVDTDRGVCCVVWRGRMGLRSADEAGRISIAMEGAPGESGESADLQVTLPPQSPWVEEENDAVGQTVSGSFASKASTPVMPFAGAGTVKPGGEAIRNIADGALPFGQLAPAAIAPPPMVSPLVEVPTRMTSDAPMMAVSSGSSWPHGEPTKPAPIPGHPPSLSIGQRFVAESAALSVPLSTKPELGNAASIAKPPQPMPSSTSDAHRGAAAASDAAAAAMAFAHAMAAQTPAPVATVAPRGEAKMPPTEPYIDLLWFDKTAAKRVRAQENFARVLRDPGTDGTWLTLDDTQNNRQDIKDRRDIVRVLRRVTPLDADGVMHAMNDAIDGDGALVPPLAVLSGEILLSFCEVQTLKATIAVVSPLAGVDKRLELTLEAANELVRSDWKCTALAAEGMINRLREAFSQSNRSLPSNFVDQNVERVLLEQRSYQKRMILGEKRIRAAITPEGSSAAIPCYLSEQLEATLPLFRRFRASVIVEVRGQQDQYETNPLALVALAVARILPMPARR